MAIGHFTLATLNSLLRLGPDVPMVRLQDHLAESLGRHVSIPQLTLVLQKAEKAGWVEHSMQSPVAVQGGRRRKLFTLSASGELMIREMRAAPPS